MLTYSILLIINYFVQAKRKNFLRFIMLVKHIELSKVQMILQIIIASEAKKKIFANIY